MATRYRLPSSGSPTGGVTPAIQTYTHSATLTRRPMPRAIDGDSSALSTVAITPDGSDHLVQGDTLHVQFIGEALPAGLVFTLGDTIKFCVQALEANAGNNLQIQLFAEIIAADGSSVQRVLRSKVAGGSAELATSLTSTFLSTTQSGATYTTVDGDRLVVEISVEGLPTASGGTQGHNSSVRWGSNGAGGDLLENNTQTGTTLNPWIEFVPTVPTVATARAAAMSTLEKIDVVARAAVTFVLEKTATARAAVKLVLEQTGKDGFIHDLFTDTDGTELTAHTANLPATASWQKSNLRSSAGQIWGNRLRIDTASFPQERRAQFIGGAYAGVDYTVEADVVVNATTGGRAGVGARVSISSSPNTGFYVLAEQATSEIRLYRLNTSTGGLTQLGTGIAHTFALGDRVHVALRVRGDQISMLALGQTVTVTDATNTGSYAGTWIEYTTAIDEFFLDNFRVFYEPIRVAGVATLEAGATVRAAAKLALESTATARVAVKMLLEQTVLATARLAGVANLEQLGTNRRAAFLHMVGANDLVVASNNADQYNNEFNGYRNAFIATMSDGAVVWAMTAYVSGSQRIRYRIRSPLGVWGSLTDVSTEPTVGVSSLVGTRVGNEIYLLTRDQNAATRARIRKLVYDPTTGTITDTDASATGGNATPSTATVYGIAYDSTNDLLHCLYYDTNGTTPLLTLEAFSRTLVSQYSTVIDTTIRNVTIAGASLAGECGAGEFFAVYLTGTSPYTLNNVRAVAGASSYTTRAELNLPSPLGGAAPFVPSIWDGSKLFIWIGLNASFGHTGQWTERTAQDTYSAPANLPDPGTDADAYMLTRRLGTNDLALVHSDKARDTQNPRIAYRTRVNGTWSAEQVIDIVYGDSAARDKQKILALSADDTYYAQFFRLLYTIDNYDVVYREFPFVAGTKQGLARTAVKILLDGWAIARAAAKATLEAGATARIAAQSVLEPESIVRVASMLFLESSTDVTVRIASAIVLEAVALARAAVAVTLEAGATARLAAAALLEAGGTARVAAMLALEASAIARGAAAITLEAGAIARAAAQATLEAGSTARAAARLTLEAGSTARVAGRSLLDVEGLARAAAKLALEAGATARVAAKAALEYERTARTAIRLTLESGATVRAAVRLALEQGATARAAAAATLEKNVLARAAVKLALEAPATVRAALAIALEQGALVRAAAKATLEANVVARAAAKVALEQTGLARVAARSTLEYLGLGRLAVALALEAERAARVAVFLYLEGQSLGVARVAERILLEAGMTARAALKVVLEAGATARAAGTSVLEKSVTARAAAVVIGEPVRVVRVNIAIRLEAIEERRAAMRVLLELGLSERAAAALILESEQAGRLSLTSILEALREGRVAGGVFLAGTFTQTGRLAFKIRLERQRPGHIHQMSDGPAADTTISEGSRATTTVGAGGRATMTITEGKN